MHASQRCHRDQRIAQNMARADREGRQPLGARGADEILRTCLDHRGARQPRVNSDEKERERQRRQDHVLEAVPRVSEAFQIRANRFRAAARQPAELHGEEHDHHQADPETGHRIKQQRED